MTSELIAFTEYEEEICFDMDDPDFVASAKSTSGGTNGNSLRANALTCSMAARGREDLYVYVYDLYVEHLFRSIKKDYDETASHQNKSY